MSCLGAIFLYLYYLAHLTSQRTLDTMIKSLLLQNNAAVSFWRNNDVTIAPSQWTRDAKLMKPLGNICLSPINAVNIVSFIRIQSEMHLSLQPIVKLHQIITSPNVHGMMIFLWLNFGIHDKNANDWSVKFSPPHLCMFGWHLGLLITSPMLCQELLKTAIIDKDFYSICICKIPWTLRFNEFLNLTTHGRKKSFQYIWIYCS